MRYLTIHWYVVLLSLIHILRVADSRWPESLQQQQASTHWKDVYKRQRLIHHTANLYTKPAWGYPINGNLPVYKACLLYTSSYTEINGK